MKVAAIFINYRTAELTFDAVLALHERLAQLDDFGIWVIDNDSQDGSFELLNERVSSSEALERVRVLAAPQNGGYGYGINYGVRAVFEAHRPDYIFVLNTDAFAEPGAVEALVSFMDQHPRVGLAGNRVQGFDGHTQGCGFRFPSAFSELEGTARLGLITALGREKTTAIRPPPVETTEVDWVPGTSMMIRAEVFEKGVWFDESYFLYFEEIDFARRVKQAGFRIYTVPRATVTHHGSVSTGLDDARKPWPPYWYDSRLRYYERYHGHSQSLVVDAARLLGVGVYRAKCALRGVPYDDRPGALRGLTGARLRRMLSGAQAADELPLIALLLEDALTHEWDLTSPGFWALLFQRVRRRGRLLGKNRDSIVFDLAFLEGVFDVLLKVHLDEHTNVGRRMKILGTGVLVEASSIGDDVVLDADVTVVPVRPGDTSSEHRPRVGKGVRLHSGAAVLGPVSIGSHAVVRQNSVVVTDVADGADVMGLPANEARPDLTFRAFEPATASHRTSLLKDTASANDAGLTDDVVSRQAGDRDEELSLWDTIREDYETYDRNPNEIGFWMTALHRLAFSSENASGTVARVLPRKLIGQAAQILGKVVGIQIDPATRLGRRVRIWHSGGIHLRAARIGNDVYLRPNTTCEPEPGADVSAWPRIGDGVDLGAGARVVGNVQLEDEATVGANTVVTQDVPASQAVMGVPARILPKRRKRNMPPPSSPIPLSRTPLLGEKNQNPEGLSLLELIHEDFVTHGESLISPGFWALAVHRFGNWRMDVAQKPLRAPLTLAYKLSYECVRTITGVDLSYVVRVGRRVRILRPGALMVGAVSVGDDVVFRSSATIGVANRDATSEKPSIGDRVEIGPGACIVGRIRVGDDAIVGANSVIVSNVRAGAVFFGLPGREVAPEDYGRGSGASSAAAVAGKPQGASVHEDGRHRARA